MTSIELNERIERVRADLGSIAVDKGLRPSRAQLIYGLSEALRGQPSNSELLIEAIMQFSRELVEFEDANGWPERPQVPKACPPKT